MMSVKKLLMLILIGMFLLVTACGDDDDDDNDDAAAIDDDNDDTDDDSVQHVSPLPDNQLPYLMTGNLPTPTHRTRDDTRIASLDGSWLFAVDPNDVGRDEQWYAADYNRADWVDIEVPGSFNTAFPELLDYFGPTWYVLEFSVPTVVDSTQLDRLMIRFGAVFLQSEIFLNGESIGRHEGGYTPIHLALGNRVQRSGNVLAVRVDNRITWRTIPVDTVFHRGSHGWWPFGGITRPVTLHRLPAAWLFKVEPKFIASTDKVEVALGVWADAPQTERTFAYQFSGPDAQTEGTITLRDISTGFTAYVFSFDTNAESVWSRESPANLYRLTLSDTEGGEGVAVRFGRRTVEIEDDKILLNGERDFWHGINRHSDHPDSGPVESDETIAREIARLRELHANHVRPGHYPVDERLLDALLDAGITIVEEIPVYQLEFDQMKDPVLLDNAAQQIAEMIERDKNNPAILAWSVGNEFGNFWPTAATLTGTLDAQAKRFDPTRPTLAVITNVSCVVPLDFALPQVDIIGVNQYYGWYMGIVDVVGPCLDTIHAMYPHKPIVATEFGAGAVAGNHLPAGQEPGPEPLHDHSYSEEFQAWFLMQHFEQLLARPYLSGTMPWVLADFRMQWEPSTGNPHPVLGMNLKGLLTHDRLTEKMSFRLVSDLYDELN